MRVLIVEDSKILRKRIRDLLQELGSIEIIGEAETAAEANRLYATLEPDVVLLDISLRVGTGIELLRDIRRSDRAPVVAMLTNYSTSPYRDACVSAGADFFFDKSTEFGLLVETLAQLGSAPDRRALPREMPGRVQRSSGLSPLGFDPVDSTVTASRK